MSGSWHSALDRWLNAGLVDSATAERIRAWEAKEGGDARRSRLALIVFAFGGLLLTAGVLLFVAAHWDELSPAGRFALVLAMIAVLHVGGAAASRGSLALSVTLHAAGTAALGAGIYLAGQIFHMAEHWPAAVLLWAIGAAVGFWLLRQWPQALWLALLAPLWLWGEWVAALPPNTTWENLGVVTVGVFLLACVYLAARPAGSALPWRRALTWLGAVALIPAAVALAMASDTRHAFAGADPRDIFAPIRVIGWSLAIALPLALAGCLRGRDAVWLLPAVVWALVVAHVSPHGDAGELGLYALLAVGAVGIVLWGLRDHARLAINVGVLGFALAVLGFYFSSVFDRLGRAFGLIGLGILFIGGGWLLERTRRRLVGRVQRGAS